MSTPPHFQLFPSPSQNRPDGAQSRRTARKRTTKPSDVSPVVEETKPSGKAETVIFQIIEDTKTITPSSDARQPDTKVPTAGPNCIEGVKPSDRVQQPTAASQPSPPSVRSQSSSTALNSNGPTRPPRTSSRSPSPLSNIAKRTRPNGFPYGAPKVRSASIPSSGSDPARPMPPASVRGDNAAPSGALSTTDVPMRSIFPRYDSRLPLTQQHYYPPRSRSHDLPREVCSRTEYSGPGRAASEPFSAETRARDVSKLASTEELVSLWDAANGKDPGSSIGTINLCLCRVDTLTYTLGNSSVPLYTLKTNSKNDIQIHRTHPSRSNTKAPVVTLGLGEIDQYNNESATITLFPKLAEIFAREQALELSRRNRLDPPQAMQAENDAVKKAEAQEACVLRWNAAQGRYDLYHHAFTRRRAPQDGVTPDQANGGHNPPGALHLTISTPFASNSPSPHQHPTTLITAPLNSEDKSSTPSLPGVDTPLMALDLNTMTLSISTNSVLSTISSLYTLDALIATILTVTVLDDATSQVLKDMAIRELKAPNSPGSHQVESPAVESAISTNDAAGNSLTTQAQREENEEEATLMAQIQSQHTKRKFSSHHPWKWTKLNLLSWGAASEKEGTRTMKKPQMLSERHPISVDEIDIERYGRYGKFRPPVEEKPSQRPRKKKVRFVVWVFSIFVSFLTMIFKFVAWILVGLGRCVTGKKA